jgi:alpha-L-fucosidase
MKKYLTIIFLMVGAGCKFETAYGPTPYTVFSGETSSSTSLAVGTGGISITIPLLLPLTIPGQKVDIIAAADTAVFMKGTVCSYNRATGNLVVDVSEANGSGTYSGWKVVFGKTPAQVLDSLRQAYVAMKFGMFIHFNMSTFGRCCCTECYSVSGEWGTANADPNLFSPESLDCGQWADAASAAGCRYMILTAKHHDGFCLWPSAYTAHDVASSSWRGGNGDVLREFVDSARAEGLIVGFYYSIRDWTNGYSMSFIKGQLTELLTGYGDLVCLWTDGWAWDVGYVRVSYDTIRELVRSIQPNCLLVENNYYCSMRNTDIVEYELPVVGAPKAGNVLPSEGCLSIRSDLCWFWHPVDECALLTAEAVVNYLNDYNARSAALLLDLTPDTTGRIPQCQVDRMNEVGALLQ